MATTVLIALLTLGAIARLTRLVVEDTITAPLRSAIGKRADRPRARAWQWLAALIACQWCSSIWIAAAAAGVHWAWHDTTVFVYVVAALTASHITALAASWLDAPPPPRHIILDPVALDMAVRDQRRR